MNNIKYMDKHIKDEMDGAECYYDKAMECKESGHMESYQMFMTMAGQEMNHAEMMMKMQDEQVRKWNSDHPIKDGEDLYKDIWEEYRQERIDKFNSLKDKMTKHK